jgi:hypothetical protein
MLAVIETGPTDRTVCCPSLEPLGLHPGDRVDADLAMRRRAADELVRRPGWNNDDAPSLASIVLSPTVNSTSPSSTMKVSSYGRR